MTPMRVIVHPIHDENAVAATLWLELATRVRRCDSSYAHAWQIGLPFSHPQLLARKRIGKIPQT
jgi:hypothetical protein